MKKKVVGLAVAAVAAVAATGLYVSSQGSKSESDDFSGIEAKIRALQAFNALRNADKLSERNHAAAAKLAADRAEAEAWMASLRKEKIPIGPIPAHITLSAEARLAREQDDAESLALTRKYIANHQRKSNAQAQMEAKRVAGLSPDNRAAHNKELHASAAQKVADRAQWKKDNENDLRLQETFYKALLRKKS